MNHALGMDEIQQGKNFAQELFDRLLGERPVSMYSGRTTRTARLYHLTSMRYYRLMLVK